MMGPGAHSDVGGLVLFGFEGTRPQDVPVELVARAAGVILFRRNIESVGQLRALTDAIRAVPRPERHPAIIALDQEGGSVSRLAGIGTTIPAAMALGAAGDEALTQAMYELTGDELASLGVNLNLAPVADVNSEAANPVIGTRSFGDDPAVVSRHVRAAIAGLHAAGIGATAKHFPGHGGSVVDSHLDLPTIARSRSELREADFVPFAGAVTQGVDCVMTAHAHYPALGSERIPATLSASALEGLLRSELGFKGVIMTDCMEMQAIAARYEPATSARAALSAGADLLLFSHTTSAVPAVIDALRDAANSDEFLNDRIRASLARVDALGCRLAQTLKGSEKLSVGGAAHQQAALDAARRAITCIRDPNAIVPLSLGSEDKILVIVFAGSAATAVEDSAVAAAPARLAPPAPARVRQATAIGRALAAGPARVHEQVRTLDPAGHEYKQILLAAAAASAIVVVTSRAAHHPLQVRAAADLQLVGKRVIAVAGREPYDATVLPADMTVLSSFGEDEHAMRAVAELILGRIQARGSLPVRLTASAAHAR
jgi:beta-N-acetylhexosaminidase